jgi:hypothetical protein
MEFAIERAWLSVNDPITSNIMPSFCQITALAMPVLSPTYRPCTPWIADRADCGRELR